MISINGRPKYFNEENSARIEERSVLRVRYSHAAKSVITCKDLKFPSLRKMIQSAITYVMTEILVVSCSD